MSTTYYPISHQTVPDPLVHLSAFALATSTPVSTSSSSQVSSFSHRRRRSSAAGGTPNIPQTLNVQDANDASARGRGGGSSLSPIPGTSTPQRQQTISPEAVANKHEQAHPIPQCRSHGRRLPTRTAGGPAQGSRRIMLTRAGGQVLPMDCGGRMRTVTT